MLRSLLSSLGLGQRRGLGAVYRMTVTDDGSTIVAHHPEPKIAYEDSLPLPSVEKLADDSPLKLGLTAARAQTTLSNKITEGDRRKLAGMTLTTKHRWYPRARDKKAKNTPMDRPYL